MKILKIVGSILLVLLLVATSYGVYYYRAQSKKASTEIENLRREIDTLKKNAEESTSSTSDTSTSTNSSATSQGTSQTVKSVHCLQNPTKGTTIKVTSPADYSINSGLSLTFSGTATVFEGEFNYRLRDCRGPILKQGAVSVTGDSFENAPYRKTITLTLSRSPMDAILELFDVSEADSSEIGLIQIPVRLTR
ncbi:MAG TPA: Gmad2 immunoglobulin-like domain-containing protein [Patescibacteria group bacterium]|nr:Gmad2 immunoglobulin-like domain-containing protein [Patescibacteria group bacterium]